jgi:hypothetical protein
MKVKKGFASEMFYDLYGQFAEEHKKENLKREKLWLERLQKSGSRDPKNAFKMLKPTDPHTKAMIKRRKIEIDYLNDKISLRVYQNKVMALHE